MLFYRPLVKELRTNAVNTRISSVCGRIMIRSTGLAWIDVLKDISFLFETFCLYNVSAVTQHLSGCVDTVNDEQVNDGVLSHVLVVP